MKRWSVVAVLFSACVASTGCAGDPPNGPGFGPAGSTGSRPALVPTGDVPASKSMTQKYGITRWRMFSGVHHTTVTGYRDDGTAVRGVDLAWFQQAADGTPAHLRLAMLDGSGAVVRRYVGGKATGQLTPDQMELVVTQQVDFYEHFLSLVPPKAKGKPRQKTGSLHLDDNTSSAPNTGPQCSAALAGGNLDGTSCVLDIAGAMMSSETILGAMAGAGQAVYDCGSWAIQSNSVQSTCDTENLTHCTVGTDGGYENCDFSGEQTGGSSSNPPAQGGGLSQQDLCANYPNSQACSGLVKTNGFCSSSDQCAPGNECNQGFCSTAGYTGVRGDDCTNPDAVKYGGQACSTSSAPTDQEVGSASSNSSCLSCPPGSSDVTPNPQNGDVTSSGGSDSSGSSSGGSGGAGAGGSGSSGGGSGDDPGGGLGSGDTSCAGESGDCSNGGSCCSPLVCDPGTSTCVSTSQMIGGSCTAYYGDACSSDADCCLGSCDASSRTCSSGDASGGSSGGGSSSGSSSGGGSCASDGASCSSDGDCCSGTCDTSSGTCGSSGGGSSGGSSSGSSSGGSCAPDGASCSTDGDCCGGSCDTSTGTCGSGSGSSSGGSSSSGSSGGGSCSQDGSSCSSASDCCSQNCGSCDGTCGGNSAGAAGAPCSSDSDCCNSCDTSNGVCL